MNEEAKERPFFKHPYFWPVMAGLLLLLLIVSLTAVLLALAEQSEANQSLLAELSTVQAAQATAVLQTTVEPTQQATLNPSTATPTLAGTATAVPSATANNATKAAGAGNAEVPGRDEGAAPKLQNDFYVTNEDTPLTVTIFDSLLTNDSLAESVKTNNGEPIPLENGTVTLNEDGTFTYVPRLNYFGEDSFLYEACNGSGNCDFATAVIAVRPNNDPPIADDDTIFIDEDDEESNVTAVLLQGDIDVENNPLIIATVAAENPQFIGFAPSTGVVTFDPGSEFNHLAADETAEEQFRYQVSDGLALSNSAIVTVTIQGANDLPTAVDDQGNPLLTVDEDDLSGNLASFLIENDDDPDLTDIPKLAIHTVGNNNDGGTAVLSNGSLTYNPNGQYTFLREDETATDTFTYNIIDPFDGVSNTATVTMTIRGVNQPPELTVTNLTNPVVFSSTLGSAVDLVSTAIIIDEDNVAMDAFTISFVDGDSRLDGQAEYVQLTFLEEIITSTTNSLTLTADSLAIAEWETAVQTAQYINNSPTPTPGCRQFTFQVTDNDGGSSNEQTVTVAVDTATCPTASNISLKAANFSRRRPL